MSHSSGELFDFNGKLLGYFEYNGTCGLIIPPVWNSLKEVSAHWREDHSRKCQHVTDENYPLLGVNAVAHYHYGKGGGWPVHYCNECRCIASPLFHEASQYKNHYGKKLTFPYVLVPKGII